MNQGSLSNAPKWFFQHGRAQLVFGGSGTNHEDESLVGKGLSNT